MKKRFFLLRGNYRIFVYGAVGAIFISGLIPFFQAPENPGEGYTSNYSDLLKIHGAIAMIFLMALGSLFPTHIIPAWKAREHRWSGGMLVTVLVFLILSGYGLYYVGSEEWREWLRKSHGWVGLGIPAVMAVHLWGVKLFKN